MTLTGPKRTLTIMRRLVRQTAIRGDKKNRLELNMPRRFFSIASTVCCIVGSFLLVLPAQAEKLKSGSYKKNKEVMGVVLLDVSWGRRWGCGGYDNAQLASFRFDHVDGAKLNADEKYASILAKPESRLFVDQAFLNHGFLVWPGQYALTEVTIKVARTRNDVFYMVAEKDKLVVDGVYAGGTFHVNAGEVVYIGNFGLDCLESPMIWRYYTDGTENFANHVAEYKQKFRFLEDSNIVYRLFESDTFGQDYELPSAEEKIPNTEPDPLLE